MASRMKGRHAWIGFVAALGFAAYFVYFLSQTFSLSGVAALAQCGSLTAMAVGSLIYVLVIPCAGWAWSCLLKAMGQSWSWQEASAVIGVAQIAKYAPGNVAQHVGRAALVRPRRMPADVFAASVLMETILSIGAAVLMGGLSWGWGRSSEAASGAVSVVENLLVMAALVVVVAVPACALLFRLVLRVGKRSRWLGKWVSGDLCFPGVGVLLQVVLVYAVNFLLLGVVTWIVCSALGPSGRPGYLFLTGAFALAWLAGYLAPGLPAGLGAREGVLSLFLTGVLPDAELLNVLLGMRAVTVLGDVLSLLLGGILARKYLLRPNDG